MSRLSVNDVLVMVKPECINWDKLSLMMVDNDDRRKTYNALLQHPEFVEAIYKQGTFVFS